MSVGSYAAAVAALVVVVSSATRCGLTLRQRLVPTWDGALGWLATAVLARATLLVLAESLGTFGELRRTPLVINAAVLGVLARVTRVPPRSSPEDSQHRRRGQPLTTAGVFAALCVAAIAGQVLVAIHSAGTRGITWIDAVEYHLTWAAHFATSGSTTSLIHVSPGDSTSYYPLNDELIHGVGMVVFHRDSLSLLLTAVDLAAAVLAAYAFGAEFGQGAVAVCAITPLLSLLGIIDASAPNDWAALWPFIAAAAFITRMTRAGGQPRLAQFGVLGVSLGLAAGTKFDLLIPCLALGLGSVLLARGRLLSRATTVLAGGIVGGGYWYVRNIVTVGSPVPSAHIPGLPQVPMSVIRSQGLTVAHYLGQPTVLHRYFLPGLRLYFGDGWPAFLAIAAIGIVVALVRRDRLARVFAVVAVVSLVAYLVTPTTALGPPGMPEFFWQNVRYALPTLILGLLLVAVTTPLSRRPALTAAMFTGLLAAGSWALFGWDASGARQPAVAVACCLLLARLLYSRSLRDRLPLVATVLAVAVIVAGYPLQQRYLHDRYRTTTTAQDSLVARLADVTGVRVAVAGRQVQFPFEGPSFANPVTYLGQSHPHHAFELFTSCTVWRRDVAAGHYTRLVIENLGPVPPPNVYHWTRSDPAARLLYRNSFGSIFAVHPGFATNLSTCNN